MARVPAAAAVATGWLAGSIPFSQIGARRTKGVDLRTVGTGTVSGTALYEVAGFGALATAGVFEVAKGAVAPLLAGRDRPGIAAAAAGAAVVGHNWSPFLGGAGGRGISPATGALLASAPAGAAVLLGGLAAGKLMKATGFVSFLAEVALVPVCAKVHGRRGALAASAVVAPMLVKRALGNRPLPRQQRLRVLRNRVLFDRDDGQLRAA